MEYLAEYKLRGDVQWRLLGERYGENDCPRLGAIGESSPILSGKLGGDLSEVGSEPQPLAVGVVGAAIDWDIVFC